MKTLLIDSNYLCHRALHTTGDLEFEEVKSGVVFGFLRQLKTVCTHFKTNKCVFCWDSKDSIRKRIYPDYKAKRNDTSKLTEHEIKELERRRKAAFEQFTELRKEILPGLGFNNMHIQKGYEADDLIAKIVMNRKEDFVIITADDDLLQLLDHASIYKPQKKVYVTANSFKEEFGINPKQWATVKAIAGCTSDNIVGVNGVGDKIAAKYLNGALKEHTKTYKKIVSAKQQTQKNMPLVELPYEGTKLFKVYEDSFNFNYFYELCSRYGMDSLLHESKKWKRFFEGDFE